MSRGHDYGLGTTNIDHSTGIRFGVIPQNELLQAWCDSSEPNYGEPHCPHCGNECVPSDDPGIPDFDSPDGEDIEVSGGAEYYCEACRKAFDAGDAYGDEPLSHVLDDGEYLAESDSYGDIFILKAPYYTCAGFCSPCAPGACYLTDPCKEGERAYCFGHDWFYDHPAHPGRAPYPVYSAATGELVDPA